MEPIEILSQRCYFDDNDLVWLSEYVLHLSGDIFLSLAPCFHHLTHHSKHFNKAALVLERGLAGLDDTPINQACRASLLCASDSGDWERSCKQRRQERGQSEKSKCALETDSRLTPAEASIRTPLTPTSARSMRALPAAPQQRPVGLQPFQGKFLIVCLLHLKWFIYFLRQIYTMCPGWSGAQYID